MTLVLILTGIAALVEIGLWSKPLWRFKHGLAILMMIILSGLAGWLLAVEFTVTTVILTFFSMFRVINLLRLAEGRMQQDFLFHATRNTSRWLIFYQLLVFGADRLAAANHINILTCFYVVAIGQLIAAIVILASTLRHISTTRPPFLEYNMASHDLPTVTVAVPARNETKDLEECLRSLVASNYPKLEILVLDDNSQDRRTPEIIRGFAQQGVRFLQGKELPQGWLAKNYAYQQMAAEANGEIMLFCGVDCRFSPETLTTLITNMLSKNKNMISVMPQNLNQSLGSLLVQPSRYAWEMSLPRKLLGRPPVLSTLWLIKRETLKAAGGFKAISRKPVPESYFAHYTADHADGYSFMRSDKVIGLSSVKTFDEQFSTAMRTRYPQLHRRPELVVLTIMTEFITLFWPLLAGLVALISDEWALAAIGLTGFLLVAISHAAVVNLTYQRFKPLGILILPFAAIYDICLLNYSMWQYEFGEVLWKGRNVVQPVMRVIPSLPRLG
jgi:hypothetical protein